MKHKKDSIEWGVVAGEREPTSTTDGATAGAGTSVGGGVVMKDKTGLGLGGWGRTPKDGRGPKTLKSVWREWSEAEEFRTRFEVLSAEEVERREIEKERASRYVPRLTKLACDFAVCSTRWSTDDCVGRHRSFRRRGQGGVDTFGAASATIKHCATCSIELFYFGICYNAMQVCTHFPPLISCPASQFVTVTNGAMPTQSTLRAFGVRIRKPQNLHFSSQRVTG